MKKVKGSLLFLLVFWGVWSLSGPARSADYRINFGLTSGTTDNLFGDSSDIFDTYETSTLKLVYYPLSSVEINLVGEQTAYLWDQIGLSNIIGGVETRYLPLPESSPFSISLYGKITGVRYHREFSGFDNNVAKVELIGGYDINPALSVRAGLSFASTDYKNLDIESKDDLELFWGANTTLPGDNGLDIEAGFGRANYTYLDDDSTLFDPIFYDIMPPDSFPRVKGELWTFYFSPRLSRLVAPKTGMNIQYSRRIFQNYDKEIIFGFSTQYLSPWASVWDGQNVQTNLKSYAVPMIILTAGIGYWDKTYLKTAEEQHNFLVQVQRDVPRHDWMTRYYLSAQFPFTVGTSTFMEYSLRYEGTENRSNKPLFEHNDFTVLMMLTVRI